MRSGGSIYGRDGHKWHKCNETILDNALALQGGSDFRLGIIILSVLNLLSALILLGSIFYDAHVPRKRVLFTTVKSYLGLLGKFHAAELFPFVVSICVAIQSLIFMTVQVTIPKSKQRETFIFPAIWITASAQLVFGLETAVRSLRRVQFAERSKWHIPRVITGIITFTFFTWVVTNSVHVRRGCETGLIWRTAQYSKFGVAFSFGLILVFIALTIVISMQLVKTVQIDRDERIAASWVVYYLVVNTLVMIFVLPYYLQSPTGTRPLQTSKMAEVVLNLTGIVNLIMHAFLRSNADTLAIRAWEEPYYISYPMLRTPPDYDFQRDIEKDQAPTPLSSRTPSEVDSIKKYLDQLDPASPSAHGIRRASTISDRPLTPLRPSLPATAQYSIFPSRTSRLTTRSSSNIPRQIQHARGVSAQSTTTSATVQIGMRMTYPENPLNPIEQSPSDELDPKDGLSHATSPYPSSFVSPLSPSTTTKTTPPSRMPSQASLLPRRVYVSRRQLMRPQRAALVHHRRPTLNKLSDDMTLLPASSYNPPPTPPPPPPHHQSKIPDGNADDNANPQSHHDDETKEDEGKTSSTITTTTTTTTTPPTAISWKLSSDRSSIATSAPSLSKRPSIPEWWPPVWRPKGQNQVYQATRGLPPSPR